MGDQWCNLCREEESTCKGIQNDEFSLALWVQDKCMPLQCSYTVKMDYYLTGEGDLGVNVPSDR